jgi:hypothetical protein
MPESDISVDALREGQGKSPKRTPFFFYFWLPAGKDAFGFRGWDKAPLSVFRNYYEDIYLPIGLQFCQRYKQNDKIDHGTFSFTDELESILDAGLNLRKVQSAFFYNPSQKPDFSVTEQIQGMFHLFSSGLYSFRFDIEIDPERRGELGIGAVRMFLRQFFKDVLQPLFDLEWQKYDAFLDKSGHIVIKEKHRAEPTREKDYKGVLSYYQLELLYNSVFDAEAVPHVFFNRTTHEEFEKRRDEIAEVYKLENIIRSFAMVSWPEKGKRTYAPLFSDRKNYSLRGAYEEDVDNYLKPEECLYSKEHIAVERADIRQTDEPLLASDANSLKYIYQKDFFYARLTFSAMEQFTRVAINFGLTAYRDGLSCARKTILLNNMRAKENIEPHQLFQEVAQKADAVKEEVENASKEAPLVFTPLTSALSFAEIYYELIKSKIPSILFIRDLLRDMQEVATPIQEELLKRRNEEGKLLREHAYYREYEYSKKTLKEALSQYDRKCGVIDTETEALRHLMERSDDRQILTELSDTRKIHELAAEDRIKVEISPEQWQRLSVDIGYSQVGAAFAFGLAGFAVWIVDKIVSQAPEANIEGAAQYFYNNFLTGNHAVLTLAYFILTGMTLAFHYYGISLLIGFFSLFIVATINLSIDIKQNAALLAWIGSTGLLLACLAWYRSKPISKPRRRLPPDEYTYSRDVCTSIYDFANLRQAVSTEKVMKLFKKWRNTPAMPRLFGSGDMVECKVYNLLSEMPSVSVEKRKYSFATPNCKKDEDSRKDHEGKPVYALDGENYTLHVEIELNHASPSEAYLTDVRIAIRTMKIEQEEESLLATRATKPIRDWKLERNIDLEVKRLIGHFCAELLPEPSVSGKALRAILKRHFAFTEDDIDRFALTQAKASHAAQKA